MIFIFEKVLAKFWIKFDQKGSKMTVFPHFFIIGLSADSAEYSAEHYRPFFAEYSAEYSVFGRTLLISNH